MRLIKIILQVKSTWYKNLENRLSKSTLLPRSGSNWLKLSAANPEPYIETTPPPLLISRIGILDTLADG